MKKWFNKLKVSQKLALISIFFLIPDSVLLLLFLTTINENIRFAQWEMHGNAYQRPLEELLEYLPLHSSLTRQSRLEGKQPKLSDVQSQIDQTLEALMAVDARLGVKLQFTEEGLAKRERGHCRVQILQQEWQSLKTGWTGLSPEACAQQHAHLMAGGPFAHRVQRHPAVQSLDENETMSGEI